MIYIKKEKAERIISTRHPWIFSGAIEKISCDIDNGMLTPVCSTGGKIFGWGHYSSGSRIAVRMLTYSPEPPGDNWLEERITHAFTVRRTFPVSSNAYRLVNGEGDFIPGLVIDVYNKTTVIRPLTRALELSMERIAAALNALLPGNLLYVKRDEYTARTENISLSNGYWGRTGSGTEIITENGIQFIVDIKQGQKTGFYLDQRENRKLLKDIAQDKTVLNFFSYTGGFSLYAAAGKAREVHSVDSSALALELAKQNLTLNPELDTCQFTWTKADVLEYIKKNFTADIIILDPPPFARKQGEVAGALKGYRFLNRMALEKLAPNGVLFTFSCSGNVDKTAFYKVILQAGKDSGRQIRMIKELHAGCDHPVSLYHPEGEYLKGWIVHAE